MRRALLYLCLLLVWGNSLEMAYGAIPASSAWDVASTGNDANGGAFANTGSCGTDFSQQDAAQVAFADLVIGATTTQLTSVAHPINATYPCNFINITGGAGCTTGWYQMVSQAAGVATMDRSVGTAASTCTGNLGGRLATVKQANTNLVASNTVWFKGTQTFTSVMTLTAAGDSATSSTGPTSFVGYTTTHGDGGLATITTATNSTALVDLATRSGFLFQNITFSNTAGTRANCVQASGAGDSGLTTFEHDVFDGCQIGIAADALVTSGIGALVIQNTEVKNSVSHGVVNSGSISMLSSYIHANGGSGLRLSIGGSSSWASVVVAHSVIRANTAANISSVLNRNVANGGWRLLTIIESDVSSGTSDGISRTLGGTWDMIIPQNVINWSNGGFGVNCDTNCFTMNLFKGGAYGSNTSGNFNHVNATADVTLTADPFTNAAGGDFSLNSTAGGGAAAKGTGFPGVTSFIGTGHNDIGALQSAAGGGAVTTGFGFTQ